MPRKQLQLDLEIQNQSKGEGEKAAVELSDNTTERSLLFLDKNARGTL